MTSVTLVLRWSVRRGRFGLPRCSHRFPSVLIGSRVFWTMQWMMPRTIIGEVASWCGITHHFVHLL
jgi:hypothetical protein